MRNLEHGRRRRSCSLGIILCFLLFLEELDDDEEEERPNSVRIFLFAQDGRIWFFEKERSHRKSCSFPVRKKALSQAKRNVPNHLGQKFFPYLPQYGKFAKEGTSCD